MVAKVDSSTPNSKLLSAIRERYEDETFSAIVNRSIDRLLASQEKKSVPWRRRQIKDVCAFLDNVCEKDFSLKSADEAWLEQVKTFVEDRYSEAKAPTLGCFLYFLVLEIYLEGGYPDVWFYGWFEKNVEQFQIAAERAQARLMLRALADFRDPGFYLEPIASSRDGAISSVDMDAKHPQTVECLRAFIGEWVSSKGLSTYRCSFFAEFVSSLGCELSENDVLSPDSFSRQYDFFSNIEDERDRKMSLRILQEFYLYSQGKPYCRDDAFTFASGLPLEALRYESLLKYWGEGYRAVMHNPLDDAPESPKWLLYPSPDEMIRTNIDPKLHAVDVSCESEPLQRLLASWLWFECDNVYAVRRLPSAMRELFSFFSDRIDAAGRYVVTGASIARWIEVLSSRMQPSGLRHYKGWARSILSYGESGGLLIVEPSVMLLLSVSEKSNRWSPDESAAADFDELRRLAEELEERSQKSIIDELVYVAYVTQLLMPLRAGDILALKMSDIVEGSSPSVHYVALSTKMDGYGSSDFEIPPKIYRLLCAVDELTRPCRGTNDDALSECIFVYKLRQTSMPRRLSISEYRRRLLMAGAVCESSATARQVRRRYETEVVLRGVEKNLSRLAIGALTGHSKLATTEKYYVRDGIRHYLEALYGIEIGNPRIPGTITSSGERDEFAETDLVERGAGYCRNEGCDIPGTVTCLMCPGFVTTPSRIPEMIEAVEIVRGKLRSNAYNEHEREHLLAVERLYLGYLSVMQTMEAESR